MISPKEETRVTMTLRLSERMSDTLWEVAQKSGRSRNELVNMALTYALERLELTDE